ncbi:hypothetical protein B0H14DRAFT_2572116 [Mycena olivaceomarginata]|nr:hypothetical protein B0H14DRAFT_2572116 [Mycena olivaceomarginata]
MRAMLQLLYKLQIIKGDNIHCSTPRHAIVLKGLIAQWPKAQLIISKGELSSEKSVTSNRALEFTGESATREELINEDPFPEDDEDPYNDESNVLLDLVLNHVVPGGFVLGADGDLARNGVVENLPLAQHRLKRTAKAPKFNLHGGDDMWEH